MAFWPHDCTRKILIRTDTGSPQGPHKELGWPRHLGGVREPGSPFSRTLRTHAKSRPWVTYKRHIECCLDMAPDLG